MRASPIGARAATRAAPRRERRRDAKRAAAARARGSDDARAGATTTRRRFARGLQLSLLPLLAKDARARDEGDATKETRTFSVETRSFRVGNVPEYFEEIDLGDSASGKTYETLLRDKRFGLAGNTITLSKQTASSGGPRSLRDIGSIEDVAARLVDSENKKSRGKANAKLRVFAERRKDSIEYYDIVYEKNVLGVRRVIQCTLALDVDDAGSSTLYTLTVEEDAERYDDAEAEMRAVADGFKIFR